MRPKLDTTLDLWYDILESGFSIFESHSRSLYNMNQGTVVAILQGLSGPRGSCYKVLLLYSNEDETCRLCAPLTRAGLTIGCCRVNAQPGLLGSVSFQEKRLLTFPAVADDSWPSLCHVVGREFR